MDDREIIDGFLDYLSEQDYSVCRWLHGENFEAVDPTEKKSLVTEYLAAQKEQ